MERASQPRTDPRSGVSEESLTAERRSVRTAETGTSCCVFVSRRGRRCPERLPVHPGKGSWQYCRRHARLARRRKRATAQKRYIAKLGKIVARRRWRVGKALRRIGRTWREESQTLVATRAVGIDVADAFAELHAIAADMATRGPLPEFGRRAETLRARIGVEASPGADRTRFLVGCDEIIRDVGAPETEWPQLLALTNQIMRYWAHAGNREKVARSFLTRGLGHRARRNRPAALDDISFAYDIVRTLPPSAEALHLESYALQFLIRFRSTDSLGAVRLDELVTRLEAVTERLGTADSLLDAAREKAGYYRVLRNYPATERSLEESAKLRALVTIPFKQRAALRPEIEYCLAIRDTERCRRELLPQYAAYCAVDQSNHHNGLLAGWSAGAGLGFKEQPEGRELRIVPWVG